MKSKTIAGVLAAVGLSLALVACGSDKDTAGKPAPAPSNSVSAPAESKPADSKPAESKPAESKAAESKPAESKPAESKAADSKPAESKAADSKPAAGSGAVSVSIDGKPVELKDQMVVCQEAAGTMNIAIGSMAGTDGIGAVLTTGDSPTVKSVGLGSKDGTAMAWAEGAPGNATATKDGKVYTISGKLMAVDAANPTAPAEKAFELKVTCP